MISGVVRELKEEMKIDIEKITSYISYGVSLGKWCGSVLATFPRYQKPTTGNKTHFQSKRTFTQSSQDMGSGQQVGNS